MRLLLSPPEYYSIRYSINPWMNTNVKIDYPEANAQWSKLKNNLLSHHVEVDLVEMPMKSLPDFVFTANAGMVMDNIAVVSSFRDEQRKKESKYFYKWFQNHGYEVYQLPEDIVWEGEACTALVGDSLICSYGLRADKEAYGYLTKYWKVTSPNIKLIEMNDPYFYHLDVAFCPIDDKTALLCEMAFTGQDLFWLKKHIDNIISVSYEEALNFACNAIVIGKSIFVNAGVSNDLKDQLIRLGFNIEEIVITEFIKAGGGVKCLALYLDKWHLKK